MVDEALRERIEGTRETLEAKIEAVSEVKNERWAGHLRQHEAEKHAVDIASQNQEKRLDSLNEFRAQLGDQAKTFVTRDLVDKIESDLDRRLLVLEKGDAKQEGRVLGQGAIVALIVGAIGVTGTIITIVVLLANFLI